MILYDDNHGLHVAFPVMESSNYWYDYFYHYYHFYINVRVIALFLVFPLKEDANDDKNCQLPKSIIIGNHNVYQCDLEMLLHAEKINDNERFKAPSKIIDQQTFSFEHG